MVAGASCVFCGRRKPSQHKLLPLRYVKELLE